MRRIFVVAGTVLLLSAGAAFAQQPSTPERSNKAGEVRGKERADQVKGMNDKRRNAAGEKAEKGKSEKAKAAKPDKAKKS